MQHPRGVSGFWRAIGAATMLCHVLPSMADDRVSPDPDGTTPLHWAAHDGDVARVDALIRARADVNARNRFGSTPLYEAALEGNTEIIRRLLKAKADPDAARHFKKDELEKLCSLDFHFKEVNSRFKKLGL